MDKIQVFGGYPLNGTVYISGAKNAALPAIAASLLTDAPCAIHNVPDLLDIKTMVKLLDYMGVDVEADKERDLLRIHAGGNVKPHAPYELVKTMRASILKLFSLNDSFGLVSFNSAFNFISNFIVVPLHLVLL